VAEASDNDGGRWERATQLVELLAGAAGLTAWIVLIGGIRVYERLRAADLPAPTRTVTLLPRDTLLAEGIRGLAVPVLVAAGVASTIVLLSGAIPGDASRHHHGFRTTLLTVLTGGAGLVTVVTGWGQLSEVAWSEVGLLTAAIGVLGALALTRWTEPPAIALIAAVAILVWGGSFSLIAEHGTKNPPFEPVQVVRSDGSGLNGFLLVRDDKTITLICAGDKRSLLTIDSDEVRQVSYQHDKPIYQSRERDCRRVEAGNAQPPRATKDAGPGGQHTTTTGATDTTGGTEITLPRTVTETPHAKPPTPLDTNGPRLAIPGGQIAQETSEGHFILRLGAFTERVSGVASVKISRPGEAPLRLATKSFQALANNSANIGFGLSAAGRQVFGDRTKVSARLVVTVRDALGNATTQSAPITLERA
jgi:hypothetical protein